MKKRDAIKLIIIGLAIVAVLVIIFCTVSIMVPAKRGGKMDHYDLECVAGRSRNPLVECKE